MTENIKTYYFFKGRVALDAALKCLDIQPGDEIILPGFTCMVVPNVILSYGAKPIYIDIDPKTFNLDPNKIEEKITPKTKAIIAQHSFGIPAEMNVISRIARNHQLAVIEDSCHALGSQYYGKEVGGLGDFAFFSSQWSKPITTGLGGWLVVKHPESQNKIESIYASYREPSKREEMQLGMLYFLFRCGKATGMFWKMREFYRRMSEKRFLIGSSSPEEFEAQFLETSRKKMGGWQQSLLKKQIKNLPLLVKHRHRTAEIYSHSFSEEACPQKKIAAEIKPVYLYCPVLVKDKKAVLREAKQKNLEISDWFASPLHPAEVNWEKWGYEKGTCPTAEAISTHVIGLPTHFGISAERANLIAQLVKKYV